MEALKPGVPNVDMIFEKAETYLNVLSEMVSSLTIRNDLAKLRLSLYYLFWGKGKRYTMSGHFGSLDEESKHLNLAVMSLIISLLKFT